MDLQQSLKDLFLINVPSQTQLYSANLTNVVFNLTRNDLLTGLILIYQALTVMGLEVCPQRSRVWAAHPSLSTLAFEWIDDLKPHSAYILDSQKRSYLELHLNCTCVAICIIDTQCSLANVTGGGMC